MDETDEVRKTENKISSGANINQTRSPLILTLTGLRSGLAHFLQQIIFTAICWSLF